MYSVYYKDLKFVYSVSYLMCLIGMHPSETYDVFGAHRLSSFPGIRAEYNARGITKHTEPHEYVDTFTNLD
jgi:hypothetical protein